MPVAYSLDYYEALFGARNDGFWELIDALGTELEEYAGALEPILASRDSQALTRLRHEHRPMVRNLELLDLQAMEEELQVALDHGAAPDRIARLGELLAAEARALSRFLTSERLRGGPRPRPPSPGG